MRSNSSVDCWKQTVLRIELIHRENLVPASVKSLVLCGMVVVEELVVEACQLELIRAMHNDIERYLDDLMMQGLELHVEHVLLDIVFDPYCH